MTTTEKNEQAALLSTLVTSLEKAQTELQMLYTVLNMTDNIFLSTLEPDTAMLKLCWKLFQNSFVIMAGYNDRLDKGLAAAVDALYTLRA